jgi:hypothetical protein
MTRYLLQSSCEYRQPTLGLRRDHCKRLNGTYLCEIGIS